MVTSLVALAVLGQSQNINDYASTGFRDLQFKATVGSANFKELGKINKDFSQSYRFKTTDVWLKEPFKLKMQTTVDDTTITFFTVGTKKSTRIPKAKINLNEDVAKAPGKRQTLFDFGVLSPSLFTDLFVAKFVRLDRATNDVVFDLTYPASMKDTGRHRIWIDPERKLMTKHEWYAQQGRNQGRLMATFHYSEPKKFGDFWMNTTVTVYNAENIKAGSAIYSNVKANAGIAESVFVVK